MTDIQEKILDFEGKEDSPSRKKLLSEIRKEYYAGLGRDYNNSDECAQKTGIDPHQLKSILTDEQTTFPKKILSKSLARLKGFQATNDSINQPRNTTKEDLAKALSPEFTPEFQERQNKARQIVDLITDNIPGFWVNVRDCALKIGLKSSQTFGDFFNGLKQESLAPIADLLAWEEQIRYYIADEKNLKKGTSDSFRYNSSIPEMAAKIEDFLTRGIQLGLWADRGECATTIGVSPQDIALMIGKSNEISPERYQSIIKILYKEFAKAGKKNAVPPPSLAQVPNINHHMPSRPAPVEQMTGVGPVENPDIVLDHGQIKLLTKEEKKEELHVKINYYYQLGLKQLKWTSPEKCALAVGISSARQLYRALNRQEIGEILLESMVNIVSKFETYFTDVSGHSPTILLETKDETKEQIDEVLASDMQPIKDLPAEPAQIDMEGRQRDFSKLDQLYQLGIQTGKWRTQKECEKVCGFSRHFRRALKHTNKVTNETLKNYIITLENKLADGVNIEPAGVANKTHDKALSVIEENPVTPIISKKELLPDKGSQIESDIAVIKEDMHQILTFLKPMLYFKASNNDKISDKEIREMAEKASKAWQAFVKAIEPFQNGTEKHRKILLQYISMRELQLIASMLQVINDEQALERWKEYSLIGFMPEL